MESPQFRERWRRLESGGRPAGRALNLAVNEARNTHVQRYARGEVGPMADGRTCTDVEEPQSLLAAYPLIPKVGSQRNAFLRRP
eukprot:scaffold77453_cov72-Phaeocystis_antarctica.AAC.12